MSKGDEFKFEGGAATEAEREHGNDGGKNRIHAHDGKAAAQKSLGIPDISEFRAGTDGRGRIQRTDRSAARSPPFRRAMVAVALDVTPNRQDFLFFGTRLEAGAEDPLGTGRLFDQRPYKAQ
jgi:hypothetical protein